MIVDLEDYIENDILLVIKDDKNHLIIKRNENDFILVSVYDFIYSKIDRVNTSEKLIDLGIFPRKGERIYAWSVYKRLKDNRNDKEIDKPF